MSDQTKPLPAPPPAGGGWSAHLPEELAPVYEFVRQHGGRLLSLGSVAAIVFAAAVLFFRHREQKAIDASAALLSAHALETFETLEARYGGTEVGPIIRLKAAKAYYDAGRYQDALRAYDDFLRAHREHPLAATARLGRAFALEALDRAAEARDEFAAFVAQNPEHYLTPMATLGEASSLATMGDKDAARALLEQLRVDRADTPWAEIAEKLQGAVDRFEGLKPATLFDQLSRISGDTNAAPAGSAALLLPVANTPPAPAPAAPATNAPAE